MSELTAIGFLLLGTQGLLASFQRGPRLAQLLAGLLLSLGAFTLTMTGYSYRMHVIQCCRYRPPRH